MRCKLEHAHFQDAVLMSHYLGVSVVVVHFGHSSVVGHSHYTTTLVHGDTVEILPLRESVEVVDHVLVSYLFSLEMLLDVCGGSTVWLHNSSIGVEGASSVH